MGFVVAIVAALVVWALLGLVAWCACVVSGRISRDLGE